MTRWMTGLVAAVAALGTAPALAAETSAQAKDRKHEKERKYRKRGVRSRQSERSTPAPAPTAKEGADQAGDAARLGGAKAARAYHGGVHSRGKKAIHKGRQEDVGRHQVKQGAHAQRGE